MAGTTSSCWEAERAGSSRRTGLRRVLAAANRVVAVEREPLYRFAPSFL